jgi:hypothetical protein
LESSLNKNLNLFIKSYLTKEFLKLYQIVLYLNSISKDEKHTIKTGLINTDNIWDLPEKPEASGGSAAFEGKSERERLNNALLILNRIFDTVFHATSQIINLSRNFFKDEIYRQQNISPHIALYITFINLFGIIRKELNNIPGRILDFYYTGVLKIDPHEAIPDKAYLVFEIASGFDSYRIEKGARLLAGKDRKNIELIYRTDKEIVVNKAKVASLKAVSIGKKEGLLTNYFATTLKQKEKLVEEGLMRPFSIEGKDKIMQTGFAIASDQLYLAKGERNVVITFETSENLQNWDNYDISIFELQLTGEKGWISTSNSSDGVIIHSLLKTGNNTFELNFNVTIAQPSSVVAYDPEIHSDRFDLHKPVLQVLFRFPDPSDTGKKDISEEILNKIKQLNYLISLSIKKITIKVQVGSIDDKVMFDGIHDLILENHETELDSKKPFYPFSTIPRVGSSFYVGCKDLYYKKNIDNLSVSIDWMLPDNFDSYYDKYFHPYDSNKFMASLSVLRQREWLHLKDIELIEPYSDKPNLRLIKVPNKPRTGTAPTGDISKFDISKKDGTLKLKLKYPDFGHDIYPQLVTSIAMEKANSKLARVDFYKIIQKELDDSDISIKLPGPGDENYRINVVSDVLKNTSENDIARRMILDALNFSLTNFNEVNISSGEVRRMSMDPNRTIVNDDNFIERILRFLKKVKLIDKKIHFDRDKDSIDTLVEDVNEQINKRIDLILPADEELISLIISEVNNAIRRVLVKAADKIIELKKAPFDENTISNIVSKEIDVANEVINDMVARKIATLLSAHDIPPKPYTPLINSISLSYSSIKVLNNREDHFFHILPFGIADSNPFDEAGVSSGQSTVPTHKLFNGALVNSQANITSPAGILFIGIKNLTVNEILTLFIQTDQSFKKQDYKPPIISWWYLKDNEWKSLQNDQIISDSTWGLQTTGIIDISIPSDINNTNTIFDEDNLFWLGISISKDPESLPGLVEVLAQATTVTFENNLNDPQHLAYPLPANKITRFEEMLPGIKSVKQPVSSFSGKVKETGDEFYSRVSERLRHKGRAVNNWDYERLILEKFPSIFKVKCISNYMGGYFIPGHVTVVPIINLKNKSSDNSPGLPMASYLDLRRIEDYLKLRCSPFVRIHAVNPEPDYVLISCKVKFKASVNKGFYLHELNEQIIKFLSPWAVDSDTPSFSSKIYASSIINFIDKKEYVDYVADLSMNQYRIQDDGTIHYTRLENQTISLTETQITSPHSILISAWEHKIELL